MNKRPGYVVVTTEVGFCSFCGRPRNLRNEQHQLGALVRTIVTCETCHRTLSSSVGVASAEPEPVEAETEPVVETPETPPPAKPAANRKPAGTAAKSTASKSTNSKSGAKKKSG